MISRDDSILFESCTVDELLSDHHAIMMKARLPKTTPRIKTVKFRKTRTINLQELKKDIVEHFLAANNIMPQTGTRYLDALVNIYESVSDTLDKHAPLLEKTITLRKATPWSNADIKPAKTAKRRAEKKWRKTKSLTDFENFKAKRNHYNSILNNLRSKYLSKYRSAKETQKPFSRL